MANDDKKRPRGFAGLDDLASDIDATASKPDPAAPSRPLPPPAAPAPVEIVWTDPHSRPAPISFQANEDLLSPKKPVRRHGEIMWIVGIAVVFIVVWLANFNKASTPVAAPSEPYVSAPAAPAYQSVQTPLWGSNDLQGAKLREPKEKIAASKDPPRTFTFEAATAKPVDAGPREKRLWDFSADGTHLVPHVAPKKKGSPNDPRTVVSETPLQQPRGTNGYLKGAKRLFNNGLSSFTVDNTQGSADAEVRLYTSGIAARSFFVREGTKFTAEKLSPADYTMRYKIVTSGKARVYRARDVFTLSETETATGTRFSRVTVTLYKVRDGNMQADEVPEGQF